MIWSAEDQVLVGFLLAVAWITVGVMGSTSIQYRSQPGKRRRVLYAPEDVTASQPSGSPPGWVFGVVWTILYAALIAAGILLFRDTADFSSHAYLALVWMYGINYLFNGLWTPVAFYLFEWDVAFVIIIICTGSAIGAAVCAAILGRWIVFSIFAVYSVWLIYASFLNLRAARWYSKLSKGERLADDDDE